MTGDIFLFESAAATAYGLIRRPVTGLNGLFFGTGDLRSLRALCAHGFFYFVFHAIITKGSGAKFIPFILSGNIFSPAT
jgi:hypothetical protein